MKKYLILLLFFICSSSFASTSPQQLLFVLTPDLNSTNGQMQRYERSSIQHPWKVVGKPIPVMIGRKGLSVAKKEGHSGEHMRQISQYQYGAVVQYNSHPIISGAGSCIFLHSWEGLTNKTSGCIAMEEVNLTESLNWLDAKKHPVIAIYPVQMLGKIKSELFHQYNFTANYHYGYCPHPA